MSMKQEWQALVLSKESDFPFVFFLYIHRIIMNIWETNSFLTIDKILTISFQTAGLE